MEDLKGYQNVAYFVNWGIYACDYRPQNLRATGLSQVLYAFLNLKADGEVYSGDTYADLEKHYPADSWDEEVINAYGCVKQLYLLKKQHHTLKVILSIGGWTWSTNFPSAAATSESRGRFAKSAVKTIGGWGFDGVDVDWESPTDETDASNFVLLLRAVRDELDTYAQQHAPGYHFILSIASPAGPIHYKKLDLKSLSDIVDSFNLIAYDYSGPWDTVSGHQSNLFPSDSSAFSTTAVVQDYVAAGNTDGIGNPFDGVVSGSWENGVCDYKALPRQGAIEKIDSELVASYSYDPSSRELISYDTPEVVKAKVSWLKEAGLASSKFWEASGDGTGDKSLQAECHIIKGRHVLRKAVAAVKRL
ncbi:chitinase [Dactylonectria estremocensis]|uniref:chitinase n=1 Tax=Dactylonectria estremocensis TaxID=1079267 RepID=A0A9P9IHV4_9HYPO|nr:chitinase [Dactylonectria estremocensis]